MKNTSNFLILTGLAALSSLSFACGGGGECEKAFDKEIECAAPEDRDDAKKQRSEAIAECNKSKDKPGIQAAIKCSKENSCEEFEACKTKERAAIRAKEGIKEIADQIAAGKAGEALSECLYSVDAYNAVTEYKEACDKAFAVGLEQMEAKDATSKCTYNLDEYKAIPAFKAACDAHLSKYFAGLKTEEELSTARYSCTTSSDAKAWMEASEVFAAGCATITETLKTSITKQRDEGSEYNYGACSSYKELVKSVSPDQVAAAELLCAESEIADDAAKAIAESTKNIADKKNDIPYDCKSFLEKKDKMGESEWFTNRAKEVAKICYGDLGKAVLTSMTYCSMDAKATHAFAAEYELLAADPELKALVEKTAKKCK